MNDTPTLTSQFLSDALSNPNHEKDFRLLEDAMGKDGSAQVKHRVEEHEVLLRSERPGDYKTWMCKLKTIYQMSYGKNNGLSLAILADFLIILISVILILKMAFAFEREGKEAILVDGSCSTTKSYSVWLHLIINLFSTVLLSTSSYAMRLLSSPTKAEVQRAHLKHTSIGIGQISFRNFKLIQPQRVVLYMALALTSVPIHLLANASVYAAKGTTSYVKFIVSNDFQQVMQPNDNNLSTEISSLFWNRSSPRKTDYNQATRFENSLMSMTRLENADCIRAYSNPFISTYRNLVVVTKENHQTNYTTDSNRQFPHVNLSWFGEATLMTNLEEPGSESIDSEQSNAHVGTIQDPSAWICSFATGLVCLSPDICNVPEILANASGFTICDQSGLPYPVDHCLSEEVEEECKLRGNIAIATAVLACAIVKSAILFAVSRTLPTDLLSTMGDAIAFFLEVPEPETARCSLLDYTFVKNERKGASNLAKESRWPPETTAPCRWSDPWRHDCWGRQTSKLPMICSLLFQLGIITFCGWLLELAARHVPWGALDNLAWYRRSGFGSASLLFMFQMSGLTETSDQLRKLVLVNLPQLYLSFHYFVYNACWTEMLNAREWAYLGCQHQALRVSKPTGAQRSTYFLTIPYTFAIPLLILSVVLHWLMSQSLFYVRIDSQAAEPFQRPSLAIINTIGYSPLPLIFLMAFSCLASVVLLVAFFLARVKTPIPPVKGCSLAISAACHGPPDDTESWLKPLRWGVIDSMEQDGVLHCALTSKETGFFDRVEMSSRDRFHGLTRSVARFA